MVTGCRGGGKPRALGIKVGATTRAQMSGNRDEKWICVAHGYPSTSGDSPGTPQPPAKKHITAARFIFNAILKLRMGQRGLWAQQLWRRASPHLLRQVTARRHS